MAVDRLSPDVIVGRKPVYWVCFLADFINKGRIYFIMLFNRRYE